MKKYAYPLNGWLAVQLSKKLEEKKTESGLFVASSLHRAETVTAKVLNTGSSDGEVFVDDEVIVQTYHLRPSPLDDGSETSYFVKEEDVISKVSGGTN